MTGLHHPTDLAAWQQWQTGRRPLRRASRALRREAGPGTIVVNLPASNDPLLIVAADITTGPKLETLLAPARLIGLDRVATLSTTSIAAALGPARTEVSLPGDAPLAALRAAVPGVDDVRAVLSYGHYLGMGAALNRWANDADWEHFVLQHGLLTPFQPPLPAHAHLLAWSISDADFWASGRSDVRHSVVGSALLVAAEPVETGRSDAHPTFLGQLHGAELPRWGMTRAASSFCRSTGATYRPHPSETDRLSHLQHSGWERRGITIDRSGTPLRELNGPVVAAFSTGVLEAAARGVPSYVHYPHPPDWLLEFWQRYEMAPWGSPQPTPASDAGDDPVAAVRDAVTASIERTGPRSMLCVIPVRGGSKGVPGKNLRELEGRPLVVWTIEQALAVDGLDVLVSTDDEQIAEVARAAGADVPFLRPAELAQDDTTEPVIRHAIKHRVTAGRSPDAVMLLQATSPLRLPGTLDRAVAQFETSGADSLVGVVPFAPFFWWQARNGRSPLADYEVTARPRRQDLTGAQLRYRETGSLYLTRPWVYEQHDNRLGGCIELFVMDEVEGIDIDTEHDLRLAAHELRRIAEHGNAAARAGSPQ